MIAVDTNILVRLITRDDEDQYQRSLQLFQADDLFIGDTVIQELEWVLRNGYGYDAFQVCNAFNGIFGLPNVCLESPFIVEKAIDWFRLGLDFSDALHLSRSEHCTSFFTFDKKFIKKGRNLSSAMLQEPLTV